MANPKINVVLSPEEIEDLKKHAEAQNRSMSNLAASIIKTWLSEQKK